MNKLLILWKIAESFSHCAEKTDINIMGNDKNRREYSSILS